MREISGLFSYSINNCVRARAYVQTAKPASEINVSVPVNILYKSTPRSLHENGRDIERPARHSPLPSLKQSARLRAGYVCDSFNHVEQRRTNFILNLHKG